MTGTTPPIATQGVHHITLVGADRQSTIDFWEGVLGMPFIFEQPNLDDPEEGHLYFDPGDGRLITVFTNETRKPRRARIDPFPGSVHHIAFDVPRASFNQAITRLKDRGFGFAGPKDRGFMESIYFKDPLGLTIELACYKFTLPEGHRVADVMIAAHRIRVAEGARAIEEPHIAAALDQLLAARDSLSKG
ncbi:VOC family protein [Aliishimia ponticola]|uniref:VOC family protein n=1 Tax=Aliishimia ponticola TaxID=2499833 RepID=A0A4S4ND52_9RHOB|nr:VOC family protein [Aliishimia ponticola]THH35978.1 VOC family protein [Aliishimia ponticola]